jgi:epoxyqueuosine reductase
MYTSAEIKELSILLGAAKCGIASVDRFEEAPEGFNPKDIYPGCKSVIVFIVQMPTEIILSICNRLCSGARTNGKPDKNKL